MDKHALGQKNRVWDFFSEPAFCTWDSSTSAQCLQWGNEPVTTISALGANYYGFRYYSPNLGRWLNRDPLGEFTTFIPYLRGKKSKRIYALYQKVYMSSYYNRYIFVDNRVIMGVDLLGLVMLSGGGTKEGRDLWNEVNGQSKEETEKNQKELDDMLEEAENLAKDLQSPPVSPFKLKTWIKKAYKAIKNRCKKKDDK